MSARRCLLLLLVGAPSALAQAPPPAGFPGTPPPSPPVAIHVFSADPPTIGTQPDQYATLRWEVSNAYALTIEPGLGTVATRGTHRVNPAVTTTYMLTATGPDGAANRAVTVVVAGTTAAAAPQSSARRAMEIPRLTDGKPDLSGVYASDRNVRLVGDVQLAPNAEPFRVVDAEERDGGTGDDCLPPGVPAATMLPFPLQIVHTPGVLAILYEAYHQFRIVPIGREHAEYLAPAWMGHSVAHWDDDTLIVDVRGFNDRTVVAGYRHTEALRVTERYRRTAYETIEYSAQVEDPNVFAAPVRYAGTLTLHPEWEIGEYVCAENNQNYDELFEED